MEPSRGFASDNCSGVHPDLLAALGRVNQGHVGSYGADPETARLDDLAREEFGSGARIFPMMNGTGANVAALRAMARPHHAVICPATAHLSIDETGAPEAIAGLKLINVPTEDGKLTPELAEQHLPHRVDVPHIAWPVVISIAQASEVGTVYRPEEVRALADFAHEHEMLLHMDGSRLSNAAASLETGLAAASTDNGVDVLCMGANKNGAAFGEAIVFSDPALAEGFEVLRKGTLQLASKMRFISAQITALLEEDLWRDLAGGANAMAAALGDAVAWIDGVELAQPVESNAVFITLDLEAARSFAAACEPHVPLVFPLGNLGLVRLVASWDTTIEDVDALVALLKDATA